MKKTNIRIKNHFIIEENKKYYIYSNVNFFDSKGHKKIVKVDQKGG